MRKNKNFRSISEALYSLFVQASRLRFAFTSVAKHVVVHTLACLDRTCVCVSRRVNRRALHAVTAPCGNVQLGVEFPLCFICVDCKHHYLLLSVCYCFLNGSRKDVCVCAETDMHFLKVLCVGPYQLIIWTKWIFLFF